MIRILIVFLSIGLAWLAFVSISHTPSYILPSPFIVLKALVIHFKLISTQAMPTVLETLMGYVLGIIFGCFTGLIITYFKILRYWFLPLLIVSQAIPTFAIAPLLVLFLGFGISSKIAMTLLMVFFPITSAFYDGMKQTPSAWLDLAKTMNAKKWRVLWYIRVPAALPSLFSGMRLAAVFAPMGAIIGEWVGASQGLGYLMLQANARLQIDLMFAALLVIIFLSLTLYYFIDRICQINLRKTR